MDLVGRVETGRGDFGQWIERLRQHYQRLTGLDLYPGTLNLRLDAPFRTPPGGPVLRAEDYGGTVTVLLTPCQVGGHEAFLLRTEANEHGAGDHPQEVIEVAAAVRLRDALGVEDGDPVTVTL